VRDDNRTVDAIAGGDGDAAQPNLRARFERTPSRVAAIRRARPACVTAQHRRGTVGASERRRQRAIKGHFRYEIPTA